MASEIPLDGSINARSALRYVYRTMSRRRRLQLAATAILTLLGGIAELMTIGATLPFIALIADPDRLMGIPVVASLVRQFGLTERQDLFIAATAFLAVATLGATIIRLALTWVSQKFVLRLGHDMGVRIYERLLHQSYGLHVLRNTSEVISGIEKIHLVVFSLMLPSLTGISATFMGALILILLIAIDPIIAIVCGGVIGWVYVGFGLITKRAVERSSTIAARTHVQRIQQLQEGLGGIRDILIEHTQSVFVETFRRIDREYRAAQIISYFIASSPRIIVEAAGIMLIAGLALYLSYQPGGVLAALPVLGTLAVGAQRLLPLLQQSYYGWSQFHANEHVLFDVVKLMAAPTSIPRQSSAETRHAEHPLRSSVKLENVTFNYSGGDEPSLLGVDLDIPIGSRLGIIGQTGSGKSTLLDVLMGLLEPQEGRILIDSVPLGPTNKSDWQLQIAHVPQAIYLADTSITMNIAFGETPHSVEQARVREAAAKAHILDFIDDLPEGFDTVVGERGVRLSGGQRQRLGIARAFYKGKKFFVLDEATSALDDATEKAVMNSIRDLGDDVTVVMIAHRLSTLRDCDRVIRMQGGRIVQTGTFAEVVQPNDFPTRHIQGIS